MKCNEETTEDEETHVRVRSVHRICMDWWKSIIDKVGLPWFYMKVSLCPFGSFRMMAALVIS